MTLLLVLVGAAQMLAQSTGQIGGTVKDASGAVIPGAEIKATQTATGATRTATTGAGGEFVLTNLPIGPYLLEATKQGFSKYVQSGLQLNVDSNPTVEIALKVGAASDQVTVEASAETIETHSNNVGEVVNNQRVAEMPLNGRDPHELIFLAGMSQNPGGGAINTVRNYPTVVVSVAGGQGNGVGYQLDGTIFQDPYNNLSLPLPFPDALQEFKLETSALPAQYGYHSTATVNAVTKSGTNEYHGDLFEFLRNGDLNARDYFAATRDSIKRNQWGGVIGGRIIKDKLFFFGGYQRTSLRSDPADQTTYVPTAALQAGNFTTYAKPVSQGGCQTKQYNLSNGNTSGAALFPNNVIPTSLISPVTAKFMATLPVSADPCGLVKYGLINKYDEDLPVAKIDWQKSEKHTIFGRFTEGNLNQASTFDGKNPLTLNSFGVHDLDYQLALGDTYLIGASIVNSFRLSASRTNVAKIPDSYNSWATWGSNYTPSPTGGNVISTTVSGGLGFIVGSSSTVPGQSHNGPNPSVADDVTWVKGNHQIGFGGNIYHQEMNYWSGLNAVGSTTWTGQYTGGGNASNGLGMADLVLGQEAGLSQGTTYGFYSRQYYVSLYLQDSWKVTSRLTLNYGVRWEPYLSIYLKHGQTENVNSSLFAAGYKSPVFTNAPVGLIFAGDPHFPCGSSIDCNDWHKFLPRFGLSYDPFGDGKTVIRAAVGMFEDRGHMFMPNQASFSPPFGDTVAAPAANILNPWSNYPGGNPIPSLTSQVGVGAAGKNAPFPYAGGFVNFPLDGYKPMYVEQWNFGIQHQFGSWIVTANYLGNHTVHMITSQAANPAVFLGTGPCTLTTLNGSGALVQTPYSTCSTTANQNFRRVLFLQNPANGAYFAGVGQQLDSGTASYEGLFFAASHALSKGLTLNTNFTWSHCISDQYDQQTGSSGAGVSIPNNLAAYRGSCSPQDVRLSWIFNGVYTTPKLANRVANTLLANWQIAPIIQVRSGQALNVLSGLDQALTTVGGQTAVQIQQNPYCATKSYNCWLNPAAFAQPALGTYSPMRGYGAVSGPPLFQVNVAVSRTFKLYEKQTIQLRAEAFNLPNTLNPNNPASTSVSSGLFGKINTDIAGSAAFSSTGDYRIIQVAMKYVF